MLLDLAIGVGGAAAALGLVAAVGRWTGREGCGVGCGLCGGSCARKGIDEGSDE